MSKVKTELENLYSITSNVFTGIILLRKEIRGSEKEETIIAGSPNVQELIWPIEYGTNYI